MKQSPCPVCASPNGLPVLELPPVPIDTCRIWSTRPGAQSARKAPLGLRYCVSCTHLFSSNYDELASGAYYGEDYENSQMFSHTFQQYAQELCDHLIAKYNLRQKSIVEIGGGQGEFLRLMCDRGGNIGLNIDPNSKAGCEDDGPKNVEFVRKYFTEKGAGKRADFVICRHVLEHLAHPREFLKTVRKAMDQDAITYFEVPNADFTLRKGLGWDVIHQHCSYFTTRSLSTLFADCGFAVCNVRERFAGQFLSLEACVSSQASPTQPDSWTDRQERVKLWNAMAAAFESSVATWSRYLEEQRKRRRRIIAWGAGAKTVTFLNIVDPNGTAVSHVVDVNPRKLGRFIPGSAQEIVEPAALPNLRPETAVITNPIYRQEIDMSLCTLGLAVELLVA